MISPPPKMDDVEPWDLGQKPANSKPKDLHAFGKELHTVLRESETLLHLGAL